jgi:hypothetical protein
MSLAALLAPLKLPPTLQTDDLDDPNNILVIREIIRRKPFLVKTYRSFYQDLLSRAATVPADGEWIMAGSIAFSLAWRCRWAIGRSARF